MIACGEILSSVIFAHTLKTLGHPAQAFRGGQAGIRTDGVFGNARIMGINPVAILRSIEKGYIPVICGFQGVAVSSAGDPGAELTTLGRGGSDTTGAAMGVALKAQAVEIFTDVDGVKTADPDSVKNAPTLRTVTYDEVAEIAHLGAKVVHPRAAEIANAGGIPLWVKNTFTDDPGTEIVPKDRARGRRVTGVTHTGKLTYMQFDMTGAGEEDRAVLESKVYELLATLNANLFMLNLSPQGTGFAVPRSQFPKVREVLDGLLMPASEGSKDLYLFQIGRQPSAKVETQGKLLAGVSNLKKVVAELTEGCTMVSLIGHEYMQQPGVFLRMLRALNEAQVPVLQTSDSDYSLSCLVPEAETNRVVRLIHDTFGLAEIV
jgi:aspartate kinase